MSSEIAQPLVSIIIPCHNAERWVEEAVDSCLSQSYPNVEIIVIDDGSTDRSLAILRRYMPAIRVETGPNRGGNNARNRGFALSRGEYIQFLDADDYLESDKIALQVEFLEKTGADVVYGDFRSRQHLPDGNYSFLDQIWISGPQQDIVASLLSFWIVNGGAVLYRRRVVNRVGGWDETLRAAQDTDFFTTVALSGADILYLTGCHFIYRRYGAVTVSTSSLQRWVESMCGFLTKSEATLADTGRLTETYRAALATGYFGVAKACYSFDGRASFALYSKSLEYIVGKILTLCPNFKAANETLAFTTLQSIFGLRLAMHLFLRARAARNAVKSGLRRTLPLSLLLRMRGVKLDKESVRRAIPGY